MRYLTTLTFVCLFALSCGPENNDNIRTVGENNENNANNGTNANNENNGEECRLDIDCEMYYVCNDTARKCEPGTCLDGSLTFGETDVDCGGMCPKCSAGQECASRNDCDGGDCVDGVCTEGAGNNTNNTNNNTKNAGPACEIPSDQPKFTLVEGEIGMELMTGDFTLDAGTTITSGFAIADFDKDGDADIAITNAGGAPDLWANDGSGGFTLRRDSVNFDLFLNATAIGAADIDGDDDIDLVMGQAGGAYVALNDGTGAFENASGAWGLGEATDMVSSVSFADFDQDGDLDVYLGNYVKPGEQGFPAPLPNRLYRNTGSSFEPVNVNLGGAGVEGATLASAWVDFNEDGRMDLWVVNDFGVLYAPNQLYINNGPDPNDATSWLFEDIAPDVGMDVRLFGMSATIGDIDNDSDADYYVANMAHNVLHVRDGNSTTDEAVARGVQCGHLANPRPMPVDPPSYEALIPEVEPFFEQYVDTDSMQYTLTSFGSVFFDANQDGWLDLYVVNGSVDTDITPEAPGGQPNFFYLNNGDGTFTEQPCWFVTDIRGTSRSTATGDFDGDGDLDLVWGDNGMRGENGIYLLRNDVADGNWVTFQLKGAGMNTDAIGAKVQLEAGGNTQTRWIDGGSTFMSQSERVAHFGLGTAQTVSSVLVTWPNGDTQTVDVGAINQRIVVTQE